MTIELFIMLLFSGSLVSSLITQAAKKAYQDISSNMLALLNAGTVGILGTICAYILMDLPFNAKNVVCIPLMALSIWLGSMVGYDKVIQTIAQIRKR